MELFALVGLEVARGKTKVVDSEDHSSELGSSQIHDQISILFLLIRVLVGERN